MGVQLKIFGSKSDVKPRNEDCYLSQISEKTIVRAVIVGAMIVGAMIVEAMIVGAMKLSRSFINDKYTISKRLFESLSFPELRITQCGSLLC